MGIGDLQFLYEAAMNYDRFVIKPTITLQCTPRSFCFSNSSSLLWNHPFSIIFSSIESGYVSGTTIISKYLPQEMPTADCSITIKPEELMELIPDIMFKKYVLGIEP